MKAWRICQSELKKVPNNNQFTFKYCNQYSNTLVVDGKYIKVSGGKSGWVLLWGIDYFRHDIPVMLIAPSESYQAWSKYFFYYRIINHHPKLLVCDDNQNLKLAALRCFPSVTIQTCTNHFKENIRRQLRVRSEETYQRFMKGVEKTIGRKINDEEMDARLFKLYEIYQHDPVVVSMLTHISNYRPELTGYRGIKASPLTTNMIEGLNGHLQARLTSIRSFQTPRYAKLWLNAYVLKRRYTKFTDCRGKFRNLNGKTGVQMTKKSGIDLPSLF